MTHTPHVPSISALTGPDSRLPPTRAESDVIVPRPGAVRQGSDTISGTRALELVELDARLTLLQRLGVPTGPDASFDDLATRMATAAGFLYGMVNLFLEEQTFLGLHNPPHDSGHPLVARTMNRDHGWCPEVGRRRKALPLPNVHASPRFSGNHVVDTIGIQSYFGAPLLHEETGVVLGTVCVIDPEPRLLADARRLQDIVKNTGEAVMKAIATGAPTL